VADLDSRSPRYRLFGTFRFTLALAVVFSHSWALRSDRADEFVNRVGVGNVAVLGFFALSGFIISEAVSGFYVGRPGAFIGNRSLRILPPYFAALALAVLTLRITVSATPLFNQNGVNIVAEYFDVGNLIANVFAVLPVNPLSPEYTFVEFLFAVVVEMIFYLVVFGVIASHKFSKARISLPGILRVDALDAIAWLGLAALLVHSCVEYLALQVPFAFHISFTPYFIVGVTLFLAATGRRNALVKTVGSLALLLILLHFTSYTQGHIPRDGRWLNGLTETVVLVPTVLMVMVITGIAVLAQLEVPRLQALDKRLGLYSYSLYLNHAILLTLFLSFAGRSGQSGLQAAFIASSLVVAIPMAEIVEGPLRSVRDRVRRKSL